MRAVLIILFGGILLATGGCIRRTLSVTSTPPGALVWINDREVGRTPLVVDFTHYGTYDVRVEREGMEPVMTNRKASAPVWDLPGPDLVVEILPFQANSRIDWHFDLEPRDESHPRLLERAEAFRAKAKGIEAGTITDPEADVVTMDPGTEDTGEEADTAPSNESSSESAAESAAETDSPRR